MFTEALKMGTRRVDVIVIAPVYEAGLRVEGQQPDETTLGALREELLACRECLHGQLGLSSTDILSFAGLPDGFETYACRNVMADPRWVDRTASRVMEKAEGCRYLALTDECGRVESPLVRRIITDAKAKGYTIRWLSDVLPDGGRTARALGRAGRQTVRQKKAHEAVLERGGRQK